MAAAYLEAMATALEGIASAFERMEIPHGEAQTFLHLFSSKEDLPVGIIPKAHLDRMQELIDWGDRIHAQIRLKSKSKLIDNFAEQARRTAGVLKAKAAQLRAK